MLLLARIKPKAFLGRQKSIVQQLVRCVSSSPPVSQQTKQAQASEAVKPFDAMPGPKPLPVLGNLLEIKKNTKRLRYYLHEGLQKYGGIARLRLPGTRSI